MIMRILSSVMKYFWCDDSKHPSNSQISITFSYPQSKIVLDQSDAVVHAVAKVLKQKFWNLNLKIMF